MAETIRKPKPIAGALWGIPLGLGLGLLAINSKIISLSIVPFVIVVVIGIALGIVWSMFGPAKKPKGAPPPDVATEQPPPPTEQPPSADEPDSAADEPIGDAHIADE